MTLSRAIDAFIADWRAEGRIRSELTVDAYRRVLEVHADDVRNRPVHLTGREDVKRTLARWPNPNTRRVRRAVLVAFYDWAMEEGHRPTNPARQTRRPKRQATAVYRLTRSEAAAMLEACATRRELWVVATDLCAGTRDAELRGLQGRHFARQGFVWISADIAKGARERWVPVIDDYAPVVSDIRRRLEADAHLLPARRWLDPPHNTRWREIPHQGASRQAHRTIVMDVAKRAGIAAHIHPHLLRHAFGDHVTRYAGLKAAQAMLGHASVETTESTYTGAVTLDELAAATRGLTYGAGNGGDTTPFAHLQPREAPTGIEPVDVASGTPEPNPESTRGG